MKQNPQENSQIEVRNDFDWYDWICPAKDNSTTRFEVDYRRWASGLSATLQQCCLQYTLPKRTHGSELAAAWRFNPVGRLLLLRFA